MSWQSTAWAVTLKPERLGDVGDAAHVTLCLLANRADERGRGAFYSAGTIAKMRGISTRTVRRHLDALEAAGLIRRGDQRLVQHLPPNRRPIVWNLCHRPIEEAPEPETGVTVMTPQPGDNSPSRGDSNDTPGMVRGDTQSGLGVTPGVTQEVFNTSIDRPTYLSTDSSVELTRQTRKDRDCIHGQTAEMYTSRQGETLPMCPFCRRQEPKDCIKLAPIEETAHA